MEKTKAAKWNKVFTALIDHNWDVNINIKCDYSNKFMKTSQQRTMYLLSTRLHENARREQVGYSPNKVACLSQLIYFEAYRMEYNTNI